MILHGHVPRTAAELKMRAGFMDFFRSYGLQGSHGLADAVAIDNSNAIMEFNAIDRAYHLHGLGDTGVTPASDAGSIDTSSIQNAVTGFNAELVFLQNQVRAAEGLPPLPASQSAPTVNVGLSTETLAVAGIGIVALLTIFARRKAKRR